MTNSIKTKASSRTGPKETGLSLYTIVKKTDATLKALQDCLSHLTTQQPQTPALTEAAEKTTTTIAALEQWLQETAKSEQQNLQLTSSSSVLSQLEARVSDLAHALDNIGAYVFIKDSQGRYTYVNLLVRELFKLSSEEIIGRDDTEFFSADTVSDIQKHDQRVFKQGETIRDEEHLHPNGSVELRIYWTVKIPIYDQDGHIRGLCGISTDITERKQIEDTLRHNQELLSTVLDNIGACVYMKSEDGRYLYANAAMAALHQRRPERLIGLRDADLFPKDVAERLSTLDSQAFKSKDKVSGMEIFQFTDQDPRYYWSVKVPLTRENGEIYAVLGMSTDMTERKRLEDELLRLATTDELTNLYNRRHFLSVAEQTLHRSRRYDEPLALLMCDIDFFKHINDTFGHATGDVVLQKVAEIIHQTLRDTDIAGRIGGEEFAIMLVQTTLINAQEVAERLRQRIENSSIRLEDGHLVPLTMSIGIATPVYPIETLATLLQHADQALYKAKRAGRNQICLAK